MTDNKFVSIDDGLDFSIKHIESGETFYDCESVVDILNELNNENTALKQTNKNLADFRNFVSVEHSRMREKNIELNEKLSKIEKTALILDNKDDWTRQMLTDFFHEVKTILGWYKE